jgi:hypothetical protein
VLHEIRSVWHVPSSPILHLAVPAAHNSSLLCGRFESYR